MGGSNLLNDTQQLSIATVSEKTCSTCKGTFGLDALYKNKHINYPTASSGVCPSPITGRNNRAVDR